MAEKKTRIQKFNELKALVVDNKELTEFIDGEIAKLNKESERRKTAQSKAQKENEALKNKVAEVFPQTACYTLSDSITEIEELKGYSTQKLAPIFNALVEDNVLKVTMDKRKKYYSRVVQNVA